MQKTPIRASILVSILLFAATPVEADGLEGPDPIVNGDFSAAVAGTPFAAGWYGQGTTNLDANVVFEAVDGDMKARTLGKGGYFGGPTFLGVANERPAYSGLFESLSFEATDLDGNDVDDTGLYVMVFLYHAHNVDDDEATTSLALRWNGVSSQDARDGLHFDDDGFHVAGFSGQDIGYDFAARYGNGTNDARLANEFQLGAVKIGLGGQELYLDDFSIDGAVLFGTYVH